MADDRHSKSWSPLRFGDRREHSTVPPGRRSFLAKFRRHASQHVEHVNNQTPHYDSPHPNYAHNHNCCDDTAPFNVPAFLQYLDNRDRNFDNNYRTHYYGDDCPGGHYDDEHTPHYND